MDFIPVSREEIERGIIVRTAYVVVSISDPGTRRPRIKRPAGFRDVLYLQFHDAVPMSGFTQPDDIVLMTSDQARQIWDFVLSYEGRVETVVVHCEQGMSRSPAVAAALADYFGGQFFLEYQPNEYVYELMCSVAPDGDSNA